MQVMPLLVEQGHLNKIYRNCLNCALRIHRYEGLKSFFKGNLSNLIRVVPTETLVWSLKERLQRYFHYQKNLSQSQHIKYNTLIGIMSGLTVAVSLYPLERIRQLLLNRTDREGRTLWYYIRKTIAQEGITGMYKGVGLFTLGALIFRGIFFGIYDSLKVQTTDQKMRFLASCFASFLSIIGGYPVDTVRRRLISSKGKYKTGRQCFQDILNKEGIRGFYLGWPLTILQGVSVATTFYFYDKLITDYDQAMNWSTASYIYYHFIAENKTL